MENSSYYWLYIYMHVYMILIKRKPVIALCEQQRRRSACASAQSDQHLCCSLPRQYNTSSFYIQNLKPLASFCSWVGRFVSYLVANPEDRFSRDEAHMIYVFRHRYGFIVGFVMSQYDKTNKVTVRPAKTQISLGIRPVWSESSLCA